jgi:CheY-like chemotaxis protein
MDVDMPVMDGITATIEIRKFESFNNCKAINIIGITGHDISVKNNIYT